MIRSRLLLSVSFLGLAVALGGCGKDSSQCEAGGACAISNGCRIGTISCSNGAPVCVETATPLPDGTSCGSAQVCSAGACITAAGQSVSVAISPSSASLEVGANRQFAAAVTGTPNTSVTWSVQEGSAGGAVSSNGLYTAPGTAGTYHLVATSVADPTRKDTATLTITAASVTYTVETRSIQSQGVTRSFVVASPPPRARMLPLVIALHGDGGSGAGLRASFAIEAAAAGGAVVIYPNAPDGTFEYYTYEGRQREAQFIRALIDDAVARDGVDRGRVFLTGLSGGATMANALNCILGPGVLRGVGINSGTLYPTTTVGPPPRADFRYTADGGVDCANGLAATIFVWGEEDRTDVSFQAGMGTRDNYLATEGCQSGTDPFDPNPCRQYRGCRRAVAWCPIPGMAHALWPSAAEATWRFWSAL